MPFLDVTDVILDPDFADDISVVRRTETVNGFGEPVITTQQFDGLSGVVTPMNNKLRRGEDESNMEERVSVVTTFLLRGPSRTGGVDTQPDIVIWNGGSYVVSSLNDYARFGSGHCQAECTAIDYVVPPPAPNA
jgi:galactose-6-phosphate isomerase